MAQQWGLQRAVWLVDWRVDCWAAHLAEPTDYWMAAQMANSLGELSAAKSVLQMAEYWAKKMEHQMAAELVAH
jgi:hypothetical protein